MAKSPTRDDEQQVVVRMPTELHAALVARSEMDERSMAQTIRFALRRYLASPPDMPTDT